MGNLANPISNVILNNRRAVITGLYLIQAVTANYLAFVLRFDSVAPWAFHRGFFDYLPVLLAARMLFYFQSRLHKDYWRYASVSDMMKIVRTATLGSILNILIVRHVIGDLTYPRSVYLLDCLLFVIISGSSRVFLRILREYMHTESHSKRVLIIGAGDAGEMLVRDMRNHPEHKYTPIGFLDDDPHKKGLAIHGVPIFGPAALLPDILARHRPDEVLISMPSASQKGIREIYELCKPFNITMKKLPGIDDMLSGKITVSAKLGDLVVNAKLATESQVNEALELQRREGGRLGSKLVKLGYVSEANLVSLLGKQSGLSQIVPLSLEDLLQREPVRTDIRPVRDFIEGKTVMVTGAGGSIGSELCRQLAEYCPSSLIMLDRYENGLFDIEMELRGGNGDSAHNVCAVVGDIQDSSYLNHIFSIRKPQIVFHAAAYKHVPLMEAHPVEAVKNNIFGTKKLIEAAAAHGAERFVMISTDKAVNPTSVMGATKRVAELLTYRMNGISSMCCNTVRFGNVLGTNGSVLPIFREQIKKGGPVTVTHPEMKRIFMLVAEAVHLVLIAAAQGRGGEIYVLDMGEPVRIVDLAENLIRLSGFVPHREIGIDFTGLRPGEKLYEDLYDKTERIIDSAHEKLKIVVPEAPPSMVFMRHISALEECVRAHSSEKIIEEIQRIVPNFRAAAAVRGH